MNNDLDNALADLNHAVELAAEEPSTWFNRGFCRYRRGETDKALADYDQALKLDADYADAHRERGFVRGLKDDFDKAFEDLDRAVQLSKQSGPARLRRGIIYARKHEFDKALADLNEALKLDADSAEARFHRAVVYLKTDKPEEAVADYREVIRLDPREAEAYKKWDVNPETVGGQSNVQRLEKALAKYKDEAKEHYVKGSRPAQGGKARRGHRRIRQGGAPLSALPRSALQSRIGLSPQRATWSRPPWITPRRSSWIRNSPPPIPIAAT